MKNILSIIFAFLSAAVTAQTISGGNLAVTGNLVAAGNAAATNFVWSSVRWVDALASGVAIGSVPTSPPEWTTNGYEYDSGEQAAFSIQSPHVLASTNSTFPNFYFEPHIHVTAASSVTNQWVMSYRVAAVNADYSAWVSLTNSVVITNANQHSILSFGNITNNALQGKSSVIFKGLVRRSDAVGIKVILDSIDFHVPVRVFGSATQTSDE